MFTHNGSIPVALPCVMPDHYSTMNRHRPMSIATALGAALDRRETTATRLTATSLDLSHRYASDAAMISLTEDLALRQAAASERRRELGHPRGPLDGVPIAWKDVFDVRGTVTTSGSAAHADDLPAVNDSYLVRKAHRRGLITLGKTNLSEFAFSGLGINTYFGTPTNPFDASLVPGGSSSGSAVAVARGIVPFSIGTDTSGSVRVPAAYCGIVGFRVSAGRYGPHDFAPLSRTLDSIGAFAKTVTDVIALDRALGPGIFRYQAGIPTFVIPAGEWSEDTTPEVGADFAAVVDALRAGGAKVVIRELRSIVAAQTLTDRYGTIVGAEAYQLHHHRLDSSMPLEDATRRRLLDNARTCAGIGAVYAEMPALRAAFAEELAGATLLCPTVRHLPPSIGELRADAGRYDAANASTLRTTMVLSLLGTCGITLPAPAGAGRPPAGALLSRPCHEDDILLQHAAWSERALYKAHSL